MRSLAPFAALIALAACNNEPPAPRPVETEVPKEFTQNAPPVAQPGSSS
jgi:hypothetical protein